MERLTRLIDWLDKHSVDFYLPDEGLAVAFSTRNRDRVSLVWSSELGLEVHVDKSERTGDDSQHEEGGQ